MGIRGRHSSAELAVISGSGIVSIARPEPPKELSDEQADEWRQIVNRLPADWFPRETWGILSQYCRHVIAARRVAQLIQDFESSDQIDVEAYDRLLKMQEREGRALSSLATRMRISQQSSYEPNKAKGKVTGPKPWTIGKPDQG
jgi:hypothetical protein